MLRGVEPTVLRAPSLRKISCVYSTGLARGRLLYGHVVRDFVVASGGLTSYTIRVVHVSARLLVKRSGGFARQLRHLLTVVCSAMEAKLLLTSWCRLSATSMTEYTAMLVYCHVLDTC